MAMSGFRRHGEPAVSELSAQSGASRMADAFVFKIGLGRPPAFTPVVTAARWIVSVPPPPANCLATKLADCFVTSTARMPFADSRKPAGANFEFGAAHQPSWTDATGPSPGGHLAASSPDPD